MLSMSLLCVAPPVDHSLLGLDISEFTNLRLDADGARRYRTAVMEGERAIIKFPKATIALIRGYAIGGGLQVALACRASGRAGTRPATGAAPGRR
jgi:hypothetical protein